VKELSNRARDLVFAALCGGVLYLWVDLSKEMPGVAFARLAALTGGLVVALLVAQRTLRKLRIAERYWLLIELLIALLIVATSNWFGTHVYPGS
jgi:hypothetical protein